MLGNRNDTFALGGSSLARSLLSGIALLAIGAQLGPAAAAQHARSVYQPVLVAEGKSKALCESQPDRVFVQNSFGSECLAYFVTKGHEGKRDAVVVLDGDVSADNYLNPTGMQAGLAKSRAALQSWADTLKVRYVMISRVGVNGSSGNHGDRRKPRETHLMATAIDLLKARHGIDRIALAGQSGGSTISASLMSFGRRDVACVALASGAYDLVDLEHKRLVEQGRTISRSSLASVMYDPASHVADIPADRSRRVFVIGDRTDTRTPFDQQTKYAEALKALGHHAVLISIEAVGDLDHGALPYALPTAGGCLRGSSDQQLIKANAKKSRKTECHEVAAIQSSSGSTALMKSNFKAEP